MEHCAELLNAKERLSLVSILVPTYQAGRHLAELVGSIQAQTHPNWELLILDDGSGDVDHPEVGESLGDPRIRVFRWSPNRGVSRATAFLLEQAKGEFWCYPGADDLLRPKFIERRLEVMDRNLGVAVVFGKGGQIDHNGREVWFQQGRKLYERMASLEHAAIGAERMLSLLLADNIINTPSILARSCATVPLLTRYHFDWRYCQDWFYWTLLAGNGLSFYYDGEILHDYRFHEQSLTRSSASWAWRNVEPALVLLVALRVAADSCEIAAVEYRKRRLELFANWLVRSFKFRSHPSWGTWSALAATTRIASWEWPLVCWAAVRVYASRRSCRRRECVLHGLPSAYDAEPLFH